MITIKLETYRLQEVLDKLYDIQISEEALEHLCGYDAIDLDDFICNSNFKEVKYMDIPARFPDLYEEAKQLEEENGEDIDTNINDLIAFSEWTRLYSSGNLINF